LKSTYAILICKLHVSIWKQKCGEEHFELRKVKQVDLSGYCKMRYFVAWTVHLQMLGQCNVEERRKGFCWGNWLKINVLYQPTILQEDNVFEMNKVWG